MNYLIKACLLTSLVSAATLNFDWEIKEARIAPDNYALDGVTINGQFPGPTINATVGDTIIVKVHNKLERDFSVHWHGMVQKGTVSSDGVPYVSSPPIKSNQDYTYKFNVEDQAGTWWYHAHTGLDAEHAFGALIVQDKKETWDDVVKFNPKYRYDEERVFLLSEMWHKPQSELYKGLTQVPFKFVGPADTILTNGMTYQEWGANGVNNQTVAFNNGYNVVNVKPNKTYRLRIIGANGLSFLTFRIPGHKFTLIEVEGTLIDPIEVDHVEVNSGQRYSVLMTTNQPIANYYTYTQVNNQATTPDNGIAILHYEGAESAESLKRKTVKPPSTTGPATRWVESSLATSKWYNKGLSSHYYPVPKKVTKEIVLNVAPRTVDDLSVYTINDVVAKPRNTTVWDNVVRGEHRPTPGIYEITEGEDVQIILQHFMPAGRNCATHPWHLHGHSFYVVGHGNGVYNPLVDGKSLDEQIESSDKIPILRDTFTQYANAISRSSRSLPNELSDTYGVKLNNENSFEDLRRKRNSRMEPSDVPCGWYAIRFKADNPGSWFMHCHITAHLIMGKQVIINESAKSTS